jgi:hypothetical protein
VLWPKRSECAVFRYCCGSPRCAIRNSDIAIRDSRCAVEYRWPCVDSDVLAQRFECAVRDSRCAGPSPDIAGQVILLLNSDIINIRVQMCCQNSDIAGRDPDV